MRGGVASLELCQNRGLSLIKAINEFEKIVRGQGLVYNEARRKRGEIFCCLVHIVRIFARELRLAEGRDAVRLRLAKLNRRVIGG